MRRLLTGLTLGLLAGVLAAPTAYYPSGIGYTWRYSNGMEQAFTREQHGLLVLERRLERQPVSADLLRYTPDKGVLLEGLIIGQAVQRYTPPLQLYPPPPLVLGQEWGGRSSFGGQTVALLGKVLRIEGVNVPAGRFNAYVIRTSIVTSGGGSQVMEVYFVPGVGVVRYATLDGSTVDLVKFVVPK
ncbi:hypothetical protein [Meiothermus rufus]|uniref:hypothetical protein n=1 Tax=Meiothermus rufus TaxID=604332 RepID=UPI000484C4C1|nr:hypothetical protein [Meiothermus rufus]